MRKEGIFAIVFGIVIGLVIAFGVYRVNKTFRNNGSAGKDATGLSLTETGETTENKTDGVLTLLKPEDRQVFGTESIQISGVTQNDSFIVATGGTYDNIIKSSPNGSFDFEYELEPALNYIEITSVTPNNVRANKKLEVVYSSEAASENEDNSDGDISDKLSQAQNKQEFYKGTVTDITEGALQIKNGGGEIKQLAYSKEGTSFAKIAKTTTKITESDVAIGDYILALGTKDENGVLDTFRILVTQPEAPLPVGVFYGTVSAKNKTDMSVSENNSGEVVIAIDANTKTFEGELTDPERSRFANISVGEIVIGTYITDKEENIARRIYILGISN